MGLCREIKLYTTQYNQFINIDQELQVFHYLVKYDTEYSIVVPKWLNSPIEM